MQNIYKIKDDKLVLEIPLKTQRFNPYDDREQGTMPNVVGIINEDRFCGFGYWIDMSYKGKPDQNTDIMFHWTGGQDEFEKFCLTNHIEIISEIL